ncbi:MAG: hypothetical protein JXA74_11555 [Anaerolineae bacterium]|nr:hypothetical protein [Anaerolineae bacterium]
MDYHVTFAPDLDVRPADFVAAWNEAPECRDLAEAQLVHLTPKGFPLDPELVQQGLVLLSGAAVAAGTLALDALKDVVKARLTEVLERKLSRKPSLQVDFVRQPGGAYLLVVTEEGQ